MKGRLRSKNSRDRRKNYISNLEKKIKSLENENFRLQSIILKYRKDNWDKIDESSKNFIEESIEHRRKMVSRFVDFETMEFKEDQDFSMSQNFKENFEIMNENHKKFLDGAFEVIINHAYPISKFNYWKHLDKEYTTEFSLLKKFEKMSKFKAQEFMEENKFNEVDQYMISLKPNKRQFDFLK